MRRRILVALLVALLAALAGALVHRAYRRWWVEGSPPWADPLRRGPRTPWGEAGLDGTPWYPERGSW